ncbi:hypothetical protein [Spirosoma validum]|uniref:Uncharacterized protein n=1 Tax=Spirosoma validum TaxID=2771355 RepID=A0A927B6I5_9BACT|nr:hypothetical protein [Spirosoma validum]MBD2756072.1 hypothetical protein [Spirosoma validum]
MRNRLNPWVVVLTAALTFGSLMAFVGPRSFGHHWRSYGHYGRHGWHGPHERYRYDDRYDDRRYEDRRSDRHADQVPVKPDTGTY